MINGRFLLALTILVGLLFTFNSWAFQPKEDSNGLNSKEFFKRELYISSTNVSLADVRGQLLNDNAWDKFFGKYGIEFHVFLDPRSGTPTNIMGPIPMIPGSGVNNSVQLSDVSRIYGQPVKKITAKIVESLITSFIKENQNTFGIDIKQLGRARAEQISENLWNVNISQKVNGIPVRYGRIAAMISHGNLVTIGTETWGNVTIDTNSNINADEALKIGFDYAGGKQSNDLIWKNPRLEVIPITPEKYNPDESFTGPMGSGYDHRLVWSFGFNRSPELAQWEVLVDAHSGELLAFQDVNRYVSKKIDGGVYPITSTEICPSPEFCGLMQPNTPMPWANTGLAAPNDFTNSAGVFNYTSGTVTTTLSGKYVKISDTCGAISQSGSGDVPLGGINGQHDCSVPAGSSPGNTSSSRSAFYEVNKIAELARGWLPNNTWLQSQLTANVNINQQCNGFWNGSTINFYRSGGGCRNTGELAGVFDHEWGHGMDDNDAAGVLSNSSEAYADVAAIYRYQSSCVGYGFFWTTNQGCGQTADGTGFNSNEAQTGSAHCDTNCSGVRDADWNKHNPNTPDTPQDFVCTSCIGGSGPCGRQVHCAAAPVRQAAWDLVTRDLTTTPFNYNSNTAFMIGNKLFYQGSGNVGAWHSCDCSNDNSSGCATTNGYIGWITADDDNGNLNDGTPHISAIFNAFNRHNIACTAPTIINNGCSGGPTAVPTVTATPGDTSIALSWNSIPGAAKYWVLRTEGQAGCAYGKALIASPTSTSYTDTQVVNGRTYYYNVVAVGSSNSCFSPAQSSCASATPAPQCGGVPVLTSPANGATQQPAATPLDWQTVSGALKYEVQVDNDPAFGSVDRTITIPAARWNVLPALNVSVTYYWRVRAISSCGPSNWSAARSFTTAAPATQIFTDVPSGYWAKTQIEAAYLSGMTESCNSNPLQFCPDASTLRKIAAKWLLKGKEGSAYTPPACTTPTFADVPCSDPYAPWIEEFYKRGVTAGCGKDGQGNLLFCPNSPVTRNQMATFFLRTQENSTYTPPAATGIFSDVPANDNFAPWIEEFFRRGITSGCGSNPPAYCPTNNVSRAETSVFLSTGFGLMANCSSNGNLLCLQNRFRSRATWFNSSNNTTGIPLVAPDTLESGFFYYTDPTNIEFGAKVLDARSLDGHWWTFHGALTSLQYILTVTDTFASVSKTFIKPMNSFCGGNDNGIFALQDELETSDADVSSTESKDAAAVPNACTPNATTVCLLNSQFKVQVLRGGVAQPASAFTNKTGVFTFFSAGNVEVVVKVLDGRPVNGHFWVFYGSMTGLTDYQIVVTNTANNATKTYTSSAPNCGGADTTGF
jgi:trimeric autotransporter adhesin